MRLSENCSRVHLIVPLVARASYVIYAGLAITAYREAQKIFDESNFSEGCFEPGGACRVPIRFCSPESIGVIDRAIGDDGRFNVTEAANVDCMDTGVITIIAPTTAVVSIIAIALYCLLDFFVRCQKECCSTPVRPGVAAAFGVAVALQLFQGSFVYFMIGRVSD